MQDLIPRILESEVLFWVLMSIIALTAIVSCTIKSVLGSQSRERTRREIAAYIAEGSMTPEQGERLMQAGDKGKD